MEKLEIRKPNLKETVKEKKDKVLTFVRDHKQFINDVGWALIGVGVGSLPMYYTMRNVYGKWADGDIVKVFNVETGLTNAVMTENVWNAFINSSAVKNMEMVGDETWFQLSGN